MRSLILLGWGIVLYAVLFLLWSGFVAYGITEGYVPRAGAFLALILLSLIAGSSLRARSVFDVVPYSIAWAVTVALLDVLFALPSGGWQMYAQPNLWFGYALVLVVPIFASQSFTARFASTHPQ